MRGARARDERGREAIGKELERKRVEGGQHGSFIRLESGGGPVRALPNAAGAKPSRANTTTEITLIIKKHLIKIFYLILTFLNYNNISYYYYII